MPAPARGAAFKGGPAGNASTRLRRADPRKPLYCLSSIKCIGP